MKDEKFCNQLADKSISAAISAIEIYNKPDFSFREEAFSLLMVNAWELLLKAKWLEVHEDDVSSLYIYDGDESTGLSPKTNRCGNPITHSISYLAAKLLEDENSGLEKPCYDNISALVEIRDNSAHFINKDLYFGRKILEIGMASLKNYVYLATKWFKLDLGRYNFFLMPISFYHGFESVKPASDTLYPEQIRKLLDYLDSLTKQETECEIISTQNVALRLETKLVRGKREAAIEFRWTDDPTAPSVSLREEDVLKNYPLIYRELTNELRRRYSDFVVNHEYHQLRRNIEKERKFCLVRLLNPNNPNSTKQKFYNANIYQEFDKHYTKRKKS